MSEGRAEDRLMAILAADVADFAELTAADKEGVLGMLRALRADLIEPCVAEHHGRIVNATGDGLLVEFASVIDAVRCASEWQSGMAARRAEAAVGDRIEFRIGIHLGHIIIAGGEIPGNQRNATSRSEAPVEPGAIYISTAAYEQVRDELEMGFERAAVQEHGEAGAGLSRATSPSECG
jgi:adenylate cyclase